jgi:HK97 family phage prohead protease
MWRISHEPTLEGERTVERNSFSLKIKSVAADGTFTGIGAVYNNTDLGGDRILPGAFSRTLAATKSYPLLWQHNPSDPIGSVKCTDSSQGLMVEGALLLADPTARKCYEFMKSGIIRGLSIGYDTVKSSYVDDVRELSELRLWEISCVTFAMNPEAQVTSVKAMSDAERSKHLKNIDMHRKSIDRAQRGMRESLKALFGDDLFADDPEDDPALLESEEGDEYGEMGLLLTELKSLAAQAQELTEA